MPLMLDDIRRAFAQHLAEDPNGRFRMDAALAHVVTMAYAQGLADGSAELKAIRAELVFNHDNHEHDFVIARAGTMA